MISHEFYTAEILETKERIKRICKLREDKLIFLDKTSYSLGPKYGNYKILGKIR